MGARISGVCPEEILDQRFFQGVQEFLIGRSSWGHLGSLLKGQILNSLLQQNWLSLCWSRSTIKSVHGDLFIWPVVKGSKIRKVQIWFHVGSNVELLNIRKLSLPVCWSLSTIIKSSQWPFHLTYGWRVKGHESSNFIQRGVKFQTNL